MVRTIQLSQRKVALVDEADLDWLNQWEWSYLPQENTGYAYRKIRQTIVYMHRVILNPPLGLEVDHVNGDGLDNRRCNLRSCTRSQNQMNSNRHMIGSSIYKGVSWHKASQQWRAAIRIGGHKTHLGLFLSECEAAIAYNMAALTAFGEFAKLNVIVEEGEDEQA